MVGLADLNALRDSQLLPLFPLTRPSLNLPAVPQRQPLDLTGLLALLPQGQPALTSAPAAPTAPPSNGRYTFANYGGYTVNSQIVPQLTQFAAAIPGLHITSGGRDADHNAAVSGVPNSWHLLSNGAYATDWVGNAGAMQQGALWARAHGAKEVLIHNAGSGQHLHVAW